MTRARCPRSFEVEAMRDGRLTGAERVSFERHVATCGACTREAVALETLSQRVRAASAELGGSNELQVLRERTRLLAAFDGTLLVPEKRVPGRRFLWPAAAAVVCALALTTLVKHHATRSPEPPSAVIRAEPQTVWAERMDGSSRNVVLSHGSLRIHVARAGGQGRFLVSLPDGELEDRGTTFTVSAAEGHTTHVAVEEGSVVLRLAHHAPITISSGEGWTREASPISPPSSPPPVALSPAAPPLTSPSLRPRAGTRPPVALPSRPALSPVEPRAERAENDFRAAMTLFEGGANREAALRFARFIQEHGRDARAEDAAYLRVIALRRGASNDEARRAAEDYLTRYPQGFRRAEIVDVVRSLGTP